MLIIGEQRCKRYFKLPDSFERSSKEGQAVLCAARIYREFAAPPKVPEHSACEARIYWFRRSTYQRRGRCQAGWWI